MTTCYLAPDPIQSTQFIPGGAVPANGGKLFFYAAGSSTKQTVYKDNAGSVAWSNPIVLDSGGNLPSGGEVWFPSGQTFKVVFAPSTDTDPPTSPYWTKDNLSGMNDVSSTQSEWVSGPTPTFLNATQFTLVGDQTGTFTKGRRLKSTNTAGTVYSTIISSAFGVLTTVTVRNDSGSLDSGLSAVFYGVLSADHPSVPAATINAQPTAFVRISASSSQPLPTSDVVSSGTLWVHPFRGNTIDIYDGTSNWNRYTLSSPVSTAVPNTSNTVYDLTCYNNGSTFALSSTAWTNDTTRAVSITMQNGVYVLSGASGQLYLGSYRTTNTAGQVDDSVAKRFVWNYYNRAHRPMRALEATDSWTYTTNSYRQANGSAANQLDMVVGVSEDRVSASVIGIGSNSNSGVGLLVAVGLDNTTSAASGSIIGQYTSPSAGTVGSPMSMWNGFTGSGRHFLAWLEYSVSAGTTTWLGDAGGVIEQSGIHGDILG